jgi:hypothetical protein
MIRSFALRPADLRGIPFDEITPIVLSNRNKFFLYEWNRGESASHPEPHLIFYNFFCIDIYVIECFILANLIYMFHGQCFLQLLYADLKLNQA